MFDAEKSKKLEKTAFECLPADIVAREFVVIEDQLHECPANCCII